MPEEPSRDLQERIDFWGGWKGLYIFLVIFGLIQIALLYFFTTAFNRP
ncbi:MAG TPA: hypothetical protein VNO14_07370 [Blastocatellia bacterium]|nr:hypothetical protein [Blastocatellia bacterium]